MTELVDATTTPAWAKLTQLAADLQPDLRGWFAADPGRAERLSFPAADLFVDLSKNLVDDDIVAALIEFEQVARSRGMRCSPANESSSPRTGPCPHRVASARRQPDRDGTDVVAEVHEVLDSVFAFADRVRSGAWG